MHRLAPPRGEIPTVGDAVAMWTRHLRAANRAPRTLTAYGYAASQLLEFVGATTPINQIGRSDHEDLLASLQARGWKPSSVSAVYRPLRTKVLVRS